MSLNETLKESGAHETNLFTGRFPFLQQTCNCWADLRASRSGQGCHSQQARLLPLTNLPSPLIVKGMGCGSLFKHFIKIKILFIPKNVTNKILSPSANWEKHLRQPAWGWQCCHSSDHYCHGLRGFTWHSPDLCLLLPCVSGKTNFKARTNLENMACLANSTSSGDTVIIWPVNVNRAHRGSSGSTIFFLHSKNIFHILKWW